MMCAEAITGRAHESTAFVAAYTICRYGDSPVVRLTTNGSMVYYVI
jgi:hypothetical protein